MSYEIRIYTPCSPEDAAADDAAVEGALRLPKLIDDELTVEGSVPVSPEDIPAPALFACPGLKYLTRVRLARDGESGSGNLRAAEKFAKGIADALRGVILLPDKEAPVLGTGAPGYAIPRITRYTPMLTLACYFMPSKPVCEFADALVSAFEEILPSALPELYGRSDTPEFQYAECGREHLTGFLRTEPAPVWYAHIPVTHVLISDASQKISSDGFRASRIALTLPDAMWEYREWQSALLRLLCRLMKICEGFFGQIVSAEKLGVAAWWWQGVPRELGYVCAFGEPYKALIPDCRGSKNISDDPAVALFDCDEPPYIPQELISVPQRRNSPPRRTDFKTAQVNPLSNESKQ